jgi:hypothetical protein
MFGVGIVTAYFRKVDFWSISRKCIVQDGLSGEVFVSDHFRIVNVGEAMVTSYFREVDFWKVFVSAFFSKGDVQSSFRKCLFWNSQCLDGIT